MNRILTQLARVDRRLRGASARLAEPRGQTMAEFALLLGSIALIVLVAALLLGGSISDIFSKTSTHL